MEEDLWLLRLSLLLSITLFQNGGKGASSDFGAGWMVRRRTVAARVRIGKPFIPFELYLFTSWSPLRAHTILSKKELGAQKTTKYIYTIYVLSQRTYYYSGQRTDGKSFGVFLGEFQISFSS